MILPITGIIVQALAFRYGEDCAMGELRALFLVTVLTRTRSLFQRSAALITPS